MLAVTPHNDVHGGLTSANLPAMIVRHTSKLLAETESAVCWVGGATKEAIDNITDNGRCDWNCNNSMADRCLCRHTEDPDVSCCTSARHLKSMTLVVMMLSMNLANIHA